ncbi:hypothetical protein V6N13_055388 [Hibiscus sabdariffa]|uniref:Uncharacterized protein n=2 Tax=Hibiscus sabdariffa TaxID=183260 RepID=A0ABR2BL66_9ROSI
MAAEAWMIIRRAGLVFMIISLSTLLLYNPSGPLRFFRLSSSCSRSLSSQPLPPKAVVRLNSILKRASMKNNTVVLTTLNSAWATPDSVLDLFLASFKLGNGTRRFLRHLVIVAMDEKAYNRCRTVHRHCFALRTHGVDFRKEAYFMTPNYLKMTWRRIEFLGIVLQLGYGFIFTDADIMWFRDPFTRFFPDADFQMACDYYKGSPDDMENNANGGFNYVKSNNRTIEFYNFWFSSRETYPKHHDQHVLDKIKSHPYVSEKLRLRIKFLDTAYFGGLCEPSKDLNKVCTMHANCCYGMLNKLHDMKIMLQDWRTFNSLPSKHRNVSIFTWRVPRFCRDTLMFDKIGSCIDV